MLSMSGRVPSGIAIRRNKNVPVAALIGLLLTFLALPLCAAAFTCSMPCCEHSSAPMDGDDAMPSSGCGTECSIGAVPPADVAVLVSQDLTFAFPVHLSHALFAVTLSPSPAYPALPAPRPNPRPLYVFNGVFLI
jgi:hypothetical protein